MVETAVPDRIGAYRIAGPLGRGGMGVVYRATHVLTGETVALKTVRAPSQGQLASIRREIRTLARIRHPGVVRVVSDGVHLGLPWYAMELLEGETLRQHAARVSTSGGGPVAPGSSTDVHRTVPMQTPRRAGDPGRFPAGLPLDRAAGGALPALLPLLAHLCDALAYLHGEGIVHRDLKPDNVLVAAPARPVLVDFGLVRQVPAAGRESLDVGGETVGTVGYMAPEQIRGDPVDARADLYALGCILYEILVGRTPFVAAQTVEVLEMHLERPPVPPALAVSGVPEALDSVVLALLEKDPRRRIGHAADVRAVLAQVAGGVPVLPDEPEHRPYLYRSSLVGRDAIVGAVGRRILDAMDRRGGIVLIGGEAGSGKTRLTVELAASYRGPRLEVLAGECAPSGPAALPLGPLHAPLVAIADRCRELGAAEAERVLGEHGPWLALYEPALSGLATAGPPSERLAPAEARQRLYEALIHVLRAVASDVPLLLVLDDLQWADDLTAGFLQRLASEHTLAALPILVLGTYRSDEMPSWIGALPRTPRIQLPPLPPDSVDEIVADMLAVRPAPRELSAYARTASEGNPFFVAEYLRLAVAEGLLKRDASGVWGLAPGAVIHGDRLALPGTLEELMVRRLDALPAEARRLLEAASILGRELDERVLGAVAERGDEEVSEIVGMLVTRQVLEEPESGRCRFVHDQLRQVGYERMDGAVRVRLHARAAEALAARAAAHPEEQGIVGHHWEMAGAVDRARACYRVAAEEMNRRYAHLEQERLLRAYLRLTPAPTAESVRVRQELAEALLVVLGRTNEAVSEHLRAMEEARSLADVDGEIRSYGGLASAYRVLGRWGEARELYEKVVAHAAGRGEQPRVASALVNLAVLHHQRGELAEARRRYEEIIAIGERHGGRRIWMMGVTYRANLLREQGDMVAALQGYLAALQAAREERQWREEATVVVNLAELHLDLGHLEEADANVTMALGIYRRASNRRGEAYAIAVRLVVARLAGRLEEAARGAAELLSRAEHLGDRQLEAQTRRELAATHLALGAPAKARDLAERALLMHHDLGDVRAEAGDRRTLAEVALAEGRAADAVVLAGEALAVFRESGHRIEEAITIALLVRAARAAGQPPTEDLAAAEAVARELGVTERSELGQALAAARFRPTNGSR